MGKGLDEMRERIDGCYGEACNRASLELSLNKTQLAHCGQIMSDMIDQILKAQTKICRIAVVKKEGELPKNPYDKQHETVEEIGKYQAWCDAQQDMLKAGYVQEVKE